jgi:succinate dehydrogenase / fumarate reductase iron-sulfur subunit
MKERVVDRKFDPLVWLGRKILRRDQLANDIEGSGTMAPSSSGGITGVGTGTSPGARAPQPPAINADGKLDVAELLSDRPAAPSPFGDDKTFPLPLDSIDYNHPNRNKD